MQASICNSNVRPRHRVPFPTPTLSSPCMSQVGRYVLLQFTSSRIYFLKTMPPTTSNIIQALQYKHFDKRLVIYISFPNSYSSDFKLSLTSSTLKRLRMDTAVSLHHPPSSLPPSKEKVLRFCLFLFFKSILSRNCSSFTP